MILVTSLVAALLLCMVDAARPIPAYPASGSLDFPTTVVLAGSLSAVAAFIIWIIYANRKRQLSYKKNDGANTAGIS
ncbi:hypothetical protein SeMB42_g05046 [Synchytrium endobioticum]|uniref:Uncharacterized protein n=1 Tax=Synchytrium endobioticum TaxID=286115 RepID=A0A507DA65_9FUNG|nr:hypothetical protein SeMB42_g05046 [Synchytrium endobioticum]TPX48444.1 hypothetical protein SeLEV6574_g02036 [Synchytrium endobioticum]